MAKKFQRVIINKMIDGVLVVALENVPGKAATQVRIIPGAIEPLANSPKAEDFFVPGRYEKDRVRADFLGEQAMKFVKE